MTCVCQGCGKRFERPSTMGRSPKWCSERCRKNQYLEPCDHCAAPCNPRANGKGKHCSSCGRKLATQSKREAARPQRELVERMWQEGAKAQAICEAIGYKGTCYSAYIAQLRKRGYHLPVRNVGASVANREMHADGRHPRRDFFPGRKAAA